MNELSEKSRKRPFMFRFPPQDQIIFAKRLAMTLRSGMSIMEGLNMLEDESHSLSTAFVYKSLINDVSNGQSLSAALRTLEPVFGEFCINVVRVGEYSGTLHENLDYIAEELKKKRALRRAMIGALTYPALIVAATLGITVLLTVYIFPKIIPVFQSVKAQLPITTKILIAASAFLGHWGLALGGVLLTFALACYFAMRLPRFHYAFDMFALRVPILGTLAQYYNLANICRTLSLLLKGDVRIVEAMELVAAGTFNLVYRRELEAARLRIIKGQKIAAQFREAPRLFPSIMVQMISAGESTGNLSGTLSYLSGMYEEDMQELTKQLTNLLEPILMIIMGLIVGFIAISIITPIYSITQNINVH